MSKKLGSAYNRELVIACFRKDLEERIFVGKELAKKIEKTKD
ncbi:MAG TPA: hypothetical protein VE378_04055 [Nitrososphaeraceae archaeon]|jgi:hypothetical protein|nr:hypothetical protein [Nitrososphaeraceae archaeon]